MILNFMRALNGNGVRIFLMFKFRDRYYHHNWADGSHRGHSDMEVSDDWVAECLAQEIHYQLSDGYLNVATRKVGSLSDHQGFSLTLPKSDSLLVEVTKAMSEFDFSLPDGMETVLEKMRESRVFADEHQFGTWLGDFGLKDAELVARSDFPQRALCYHFYVRLFHYAKTLRYKFDDVIPYLGKIRERRDIVRRLDW